MTQKWFQMEHVRRHESRYIVGYRSNTIDVLVFLSFGTIKRKKKFSNLSPSMLQVRTYIWVCVCIEQICQFILIEPHTFISNNKRFIYIFFPLRSFVFKLKFIGIVHYNRNNIGNGTNGCSTRRFVKRYCNRWTCWTRWRWFKMDESDDGSRISATISCCSLWMSCRTIFDRCNRNKYLLQQVRFFLWTDPIFSDHKFIFPFLFFHCSLNRLIVYHHLSNGRFFDPNIHTHTRQK